ncbi:MAG: hypothetical protein K0R00_3494 [Herbinix sp.]|jgi:hypothetical protein|nr:hypothetical protein [Herbinix sp.]
MSITEQRLKYKTPDKHIFGVFLVRYKYVNQCSKIYFLNSQFSP